MDILIEAGYEAYQSIQSKTADMDLKRLKEKYGDKITPWGGINIENLVEGTLKKNKEDVIYALKYAAPGGGFILGTSIVLPTKASMIIIWQLLISFINMVALLSSFEES